MPTETEPLVRARHVKEWLLAIEKEPDPWRAKFFAALPAADRALIDTAPNVSWLPMRLHVELADILLEAFGGTRTHAYYRQAFAASLRGPVFGPMLRTGLKLFGVTPGAFLRWADKGWEASFRNCGSARGEVLEPGRGRLVYRDLPAVCIASDAWVDSSLSSAYGALDTMEAEGVIRLDKSRRAEGSLVLEIEWNVPSAR